MKNRNRRNNGEIMVEQIQEEFEDWKEKYDNILQIPPKIKNKDRKSLIEQTQLIRNEDGEISISGGGKVLLFIIKDFGKSFDKFLDDIKKRKNKGCYLEAIQFKHRENLFDIDLINKVNEMSVKKLLK